MNRRRPASPVPNPNPLSCDVLVVGGGSAGYAAARTAAAAGATVLVVEGGPKVGGLCILRGCMPTKALLESSQRLHEIQRAATFGIRAGAARPDPAAILRRKNRLIAGFAHNRRQQLQDGPFQFVRGHLRFRAPGQAEILPLRAAKRKARASSAPVPVTFRRAVIATGSVAATVPVPGLAETGFLTSDSALELAKLPKSLVVLGGGVVACELAQHFARLGVEVTQIQRSPRILKELDPAASAVLEKVFRREGINLFTRTRLLRAGSRGRLKRVTFEHRGCERHASAEEILFALGRNPNTESLNLPALGVELDGPAIRVDAHMETTAPGVFAAGDVTGLFEVVHIAIQQGETAGANAADGGRREWDSRLKTQVVFTDPQIATVGASEEELRAAPGPGAFLAASHPFGDHGKSMIHGAADGFVKLLAARSGGEILGACLVGHLAGEIIHEIIAAMHWRGTAAQLAAMPHYHPTLAEILTYPAEDLAARCSPGP